MPFGAGKPLNWPPIGPDEGGYIGISWPINGRGAKPGGLDGNPLTPGKPSGGPLPRGDSGADG